MTLAQTKPSGLESTMRLLGEAAKSASTELALATPERKTAALHAMAKAIRDRPPLARWQAVTLAPITLSIQSRTSRGS